MKCKWIRSKLSFIGKRQTVSGDIVKRLLHGVFIMSCPVNFDLFFKNLVFPQSGQCNSDVEKEIFYNTLARDYVSNQIIRVFIKKIP